MTVQNIDPVRIYNSAQTRLLVWRELYSTQIPIDYYKVKRYSTPNKSTPSREIIVTYNFKKDIHLKLYQQRQNLSRCSNMRRGSNIWLAPLEIVFSVSRFEPVLNWNRFLDDQGRGLNSLNWALPSLNHLLSRCDAWDQHLPLNLLDDWKKSRLFKKVFSERRNIKHCIVRIHNWFKFKSI